MVGGIEVDMGNEEFRKILNSVAIWPSSVEEDPFLHSEFPL